MAEINIRGIQDIQKLEGWSIKKVISIAPILSLRLSNPLAEKDILFSLNPYAIPGANSQFSSLITGVHINIQDAEIEQPHIEMQSG